MYSFFESDEVLSDSEGVKDAREQLALILGAFPRVDAKLSTVLSIDTAILATMSAAMPAAPRISTFASVCVAVAAVALAFSFVHLYRGSFPSPKDGPSLITYFSDIAGHTETEFIAMYRAQDAETIQNDLLAQVWRNADILTLKYRHLKRAFVFMSASLLPWTCALASFSMSRQGIHLPIRA